jgi:hypothetical protein
MFARPSGLSLALALMALAIGISVPHAALADDINLPYCPLDPVKPVDPNAPVPPPSPPGPPVRPVLPDEPPMPPASPAKVTPTPAYYQKAALWSQIPNSQSWTNTVIQIVESRLADFEQARDIETFCPGYLVASQPQREICWLRLVGSIAEFESSFKPAERPFCEGNAVFSVGLLALSTGECPNAMDIAGLQDPVQNLTCGLNRMAKLIKRDHEIEGQDQGGACAYWSTLRTPHTATLSNGKTYILGKKDQVIQRTKLFNRF